MTGDGPLFHEPNGPRAGDTPGAVRRPSSTVTVEGEELRALRRSAREAGQLRARVAKMEGELGRVREANRKLRDRVAQLTGASPSAAELARRELAAVHREEFARIRRRITRGGDASQPPR